jgi:hypothetical protein
MQLIQAFIKRFDGHVIAPVVEKKGESTSGEANEALTAS